LLIIQSISKFIAMQEETKQVSNQVQ